jgi:hypothetical protein
MPGLGHLTIFRFGCTVCPVKIRASSILLVIGLMAGVMQLGACAPAQTSASSAAVSGDASNGKKVSNALTTESQRQQEKREEFDTHGSMPYNGEPPGYFGSSGNSFSGSF